LSRVLVIGAANVDIIGVSKEIMLAHDSNPGSIDLYVGGVAKNIAENLKRLDVEVSLLTFIGNDAFADFLKHSFNEINLDYSLSFNLNHQSGKFVSIHQPDGQLAMAVNDFELLNLLTPEMFEPLISQINTFDFLILDTNLPENVLVFLINQFEHKPIAVDGVSAKKVIKIKNVLDKISLLKVNQAELSALLERPVDDIILSLKELLKTGVKKVIVTNGKNPITYNIDKSIYQTFIFEARKLVSSIGCGDAMFSGTIYGLLKGKTIHEAINYGKKAASFTMEVSSACHPELTCEILEN
jgi:pseudouridine kinase